MVSEAHRILGSICLILLSYCLIITFLWTGYISFNKGIWEISGKWITRINIYILFLTSILSVVFISNSF